MSYATWKIWQIADKCIAIITSLITSKFIAFIIAPH